MNWIIYHFASGSAFFSGVALLSAGALLGLSRRRWLNRVGTLIAIVGLLVVTASATPLSFWFYVPAACATLTSLVVVRRSQRREYRRAATAALFGVCALGLWFEIPHHIERQVPPRTGRAITIFGDSVTAGIEEGEAETWPQILARTKHLQIGDYSQMGATVKTALRKAKAADIPQGIIIIEIGGNDLFGKTSAEEFRERLEALLNYLSGPGRQLVMLELPLPPFFNAYGRVQRQLADKHKVLLVPKRLTMRVLTSDAATLDSIHLSQRGHRLMAETIWRILQPAFVSQGEIQPRR
jgi:acyl-CoA thioesterase-1